MTAVTGPSQTALRKQSGRSFCVLGMKRLLFVLTLLAGALTPAAFANSSDESAAVQTPQHPRVWMVLRYGAAPQSAALEKIEMLDMD